MTGSAPDGSDGLTIWWVRHGPTHARAMMGWTDVAADLSDRDRLERLSAFLPDGAPVLSSDLRRASATADALAGGRPRLPHRPGLRELNFGGWEGRTFAEVQQDDAERLAGFWGRPDETRPPDGESWADLRARVAAEVADLAARHGGDLIVVAHFGVILSQLEAALAMPAPKIFARHVDHLSVTRIAMPAAGADGAPVAELINHRP